MKIICYSGHDIDGDRTARVSIKGLSETMNFLEGNITNNTLGINFQACYIVIDMLKEVYLLGKQGIDVEFIEVADNDIYGENYK